jgi:hypothetical protein
LKGVLLTLAITVILLIYSSTARELILKSESSTIAAKIINAVYPILPQAMHQILHPYLHQLEGELPLNLHDSDVENDLNTDVIPSHDNVLTPTNSGARRSRDDDYAPAPRRRVRTLVEDDDQGLPPAPLPRRRSTQYDDPEPRDTRRYDSATNTNRRSSTDERDEPIRPTQRALVPTQADNDDDPFSSRNSDRSTRQRR